MRKQQCCVLTGTLCTILVGIGLILLSLCLMYPDMMLSFVEPTFARIVLFLGVSACIIGFVGALGTCCSSRITLFIFGITTLVLSLAGIVVGFALLAAANSHGEEVRRSCTVNHQVHSTWSELTRSYQQSYDSMKQALLNCRQNGRPLALGLSDCGQLGRDNQGAWFAENQHKDLFIWLEKRSGCGGFCSGGIPLFAYPAVPEGAHVDQATKQKTRQACFKLFSDELEVRGDRAALLTILLSAPLLFAVCGALWIVCYPPPRARKDYIHAPLGDSDDDDDDLASNRLLAADHDHMVWNGRAGHGASDSDSG